MRFAANRATVATLAAIIIAPALVTSALAAEARKRQESKAVTVEAVWAAIGDFCNIKTWHPAIADCAMSEMDGKQIRTLTTGDGAKFVEALVSYDDAAMSYTYTILESPLPVENYESTLSVKADDDGGAAVLWTSTFDAKGVTDEEAKAIVEGIYAAGIEAVLAKAAK